MEDSELELRDELIENYSQARKEDDLSQPKSLTSRIVIKVLGEVPKLSLPVGWIAVNHESGGLVYLHKESRVVTWSRPYHLGDSSLRKHHVPVIAIPCLHQSIYLDTQNKNHVKKRKLTDWKMSNAIETKRTRTDKDDNEIEVVSSPDQISPCEETEKTINSKHVTSTARTQVQQTACILEDSKPCTNPSNQNGVISDSPSSENSIACSSAPTSNANTTVSENHTPVSLRSQSPPDDVWDTRTDSEDGNHNNTHSKPMQTPTSKSSTHYHQEIHQKCPIEKFVSHGLDEVESSQLHKYLSRLFEFKILSKDEAIVPIFHDGSEPKKGMQQPTLPDNLKTIPCLHKKSTTQESKNDIISAGKTHLAILNEYCQRTLKTKLAFVDAIPVGDLFVVEAEIDGIKYGKGQGHAKKMAKHDAAKKTMQILVPEKYGEINDFVFSGKELEIFDTLDVDDPAVYECTRRLGLPSPSEVLSICLRRNRVICPSNIHFKLTPGVKNDPHKYEIICGENTATGFCKNRKIGKQLASQEILKKIHPKLLKWGQLLRIYCDAPSNLIRETNKVSRDKEISRMVKTDSRLLQELKEEMRKLKSNSQSVSLQR